MESFLNRRGTELPHLSTWFSYGHAQNLFILNFTYYFSYFFNEHAQIPALTQNKEVNDKTLPGLVFSESFQGTWTKS